MKKIIGIIAILLIAMTLIGCTGPAPADTNTPIEQPIINNEAQARDTVTDVSTDIAGIEESLNDIEGIIAE